ncbi:MAG: lipopolysaccharide biosynthesis protein [Ilumatobacteraceae bacterium]
MSGVRRFTSFERRSLTMSASIAAMAAGGVAFNAVAARLVEPSRLGLYASLFFWLALINNVTSLGLPTVMSRLLRYPAELGGRIAAWSFATTATTSAIGVAALVVLATRVLRPELAAELRRWPLGVTLSILCGLAAGVALSALVEIRMVALGMYRLAVARSVTTNALRCGLVLVPVLQGRTVLLLVASIGANAASGILGAALLVRQNRHLGRSALDATREWRVEFRTAAANWAGTIALVAAQFAFPIFTNLSPGENAAFYLAWQSMAIVFLLVSNIGVALTIDSSESRRTAPVRRALILSLGVAAAAVVSSWLLADPIEALLFTARYRLATDALPLLLVSALPWSVTTTLIAAARTDGRHLSVALTCTAYLAATAVALALSGADAPRSAALTWLVANLAAMTISIVVDQWSRSRRLHSPLVRALQQ